MPPIKRQTSCRHESTERASQHLEDKEDRKPLSKLVLGVPCAEEVDDSREEDCFGDTQENAEGKEGAVVLGGGRGAAYTAPYYGGAADVCGVKRRGLGRPKVVGGKSVWVGRT